MYSFLADSTAPPPGPPPSCIPRSSLSLQIHHPMDPHQVHLYRRWQQQQRETEEQERQTREAAERSAAEDGVHGGASAFAEVFDTRAPGAFRQMTFSKFKKTDVKRELINSLLNARVEAANYWSAELLCAGHQMDLWEYLMFYMGKHVSLANPKLPIYVHMRLQSYVTIEKRENLNDVLSFRNSENMRRLFAELTSVMCFSPRRPTYEYVRIDRAEEFDLSNLRSERLRAPSPEFARRFFRKDDAREVFIPCNEFAYALRAGDVSQSLYWIEWLFQFEAMCKRKRDHVLCDRRAVNVSLKLQDQLVWLIWEILQGTVDEKEECLRVGGEDVASKVVHALHDLFCFGYTSMTVARRRKYMLYQAVFVVAEQWNDAVPIVHRREDVQHVLKQVNNFYSEISKSAVLENGNYLMMSTLSDVGASAAARATAGSGNIIVRPLVDEYSAEAVYGWRMPTPVPAPMTVDSSHSLPHRVYRRAMQSNAGTIVVPLLRSNHSQNLQAGSRARHQPTNPCDETKSCVLSYFNECDADKFDADECDADEFDADECDTDEFDADECDADESDTDECDDGEF